MNGPFFGTVQDAGIAVPTLLRIGDLGRFLLLRAKEYVLWADVDTDAATNTVIFINDGRHSLLLLTPGHRGTKQASKSQYPNPK
jgi:hypothetical protein